MYVLRFGVSVKRSNKTVASWLGFNTDESTHGASVTFSTACSRPFVFMSLLFPALLQASPSVPIHIANVVWCEKLMAHAHSTSARKRGGAACRGNAVAHGWPSPRVACRDRLVRPYANGACLARVAGPCINSLRSLRSPYSREQAMHVAISSTRVCIGENQRTGNLAQFELWLVLCVLIVY
jgi:hypothetical protein